IRDFHVTGVQTCALPICPLRARLGLDHRSVAVDGRRLDRPLRRSQHTRNGDTVVTDKSAGPSRASILKVVAASMAGTTVEWYDFFLYGVAAALVFPAVFFPSDDPAVGTLLALGTFAIGFVARPLGGLV